MLAINAREQAKDPGFSLADMGDRVHPLKRGHFVMAYLFLKAMGLDSKVAEMEIDASHSRVLTAESCEISNLRKTDPGVRFDCLARAIPFPTTAFEFDGVVPFDEEFNQEILRVRGLEAPSYALSIDGTNVGVYTPKELDRGVNLAMNTATPQYQQALKAESFSRRSWLKGTSKRHLIWTLRLMHIRRLHTPLEQLKYMTSRKPHYREINQQREAEFIRLLEEDRLEEVFATSIREAEALNDQTYKGCAPERRTYVLTRVDK